jgi:sporulation protein YlmC with PRC-barrel domain
MLDTNTAVGWRGHELVDRDGDKIGTIAEIYLDAETNEPEWATVKTGLFGTRQAFVPIRDATSEGELVRVPFEKSQVKHAPSIDAEQQLSHAEEQELYDHYGIEYSRERSGSQLPEGGGGPGQEAMPPVGTAPGAGEARGTAEGGPGEGESPETEVLPEATGERRKRMRT